MRRYHYPHDADETPAPGFIPGRWFLIPAHDWLRQGGLEEWISVRYLDALKGPPQSPDPSPRVIHAAVCDAELLPMWHPRLVDMQLWCVERFLEIFRRHSDEPVPIIGGPSLHPQGVLDGEFIDAVKGGAKRPVILAHAERMKPIYREAGCVTVGWNIETEAAFDASMEYLSAALAHAREVYPALHLTTWGTGIYRQAGKPLIAEHAARLAGVLGGADSVRVYGSKAENATLTDALQE